MRVNFRIFIVSAAGVTQCAEAADGVEEAMDIMMADRVPAERAAEFSLAAARLGRDPVAFARHFVKLRQAIR